MVHLKPNVEEEIQAIDRHSFRFQHLLLFILGSAIAHALIFWLLVKHETSKPIEKKKENKPIEFIVVPPEESPKPPPDTNNRATENSVAESEVQPEGTVSNETITNEPPITSPPPPAPAPAPVPEVAEPEPAPAPASVSGNAPKPESKPSAKDLMSGSDTPTASPEPKKETVATRLPPKTDPKPSNSSEGSAADLLGGDYQKTLANSGDAFFSPEALSHKSVLSPQQIDALKDPELASYANKLQRLISENWQRNWQQNWKQNWKPEIYRDSVVVFVFNIQKNGQITGLKIAKSSGSEEIDRYYLEAINKISFPPLPSEFPLESWGVNYTLETILIE